MKISAKLILLISLAFLGCLVVGGVALARLSIMDAEIRSLSDKTIPGIEQLKNINTSFLDLRLLVNRHALSFDGDEKKALDERIKTKQQQLNQSLQSYKALLSNEERQAYAQTEKLLLSYLTTADDVLVLSRKYQNSKAQELMIALTEQGDRITALLDKAASQNHQQVQNSSQRAGAAYEKAFSQLILSVVIVLVGLVLIGGWLFWQIRHGIRSAVSTISRIEQSRDFTLRAEITSNDEISHLLMAFNALIARLQENFGQFQQGIQQVTSISDRLLDAASCVANTAGIQQSSSSQMAAAVEQMTVSINHVADQAQGASERSHEAGDQATQGLVVIANTVADIHAISGAVSEAAKELHNLENENRTIASVINVISAVAAQTNLLALNAAIEAARAGEMGRGFAVVADEVRNLAARTASATQEISSIINKVQNLSASAVHLMQEAVNKVEAGVSSASEASQKMNDICSVAGDSEALVQDISHAIREQGQATDVIAQQVETVASQANENSNSAASCQMLANELTGISHKMEDVLRSYSL
jgi:methyl-accepting chemotaxis protein